VKNSLCALRLSLNREAARSCCSNKEGLPLATQERHPEGQRSKSKIPQLFRVAIGLFSQMDYANVVFLSVSLRYSLQNAVDAYYMSSQTVKGLSISDTLEMINAIRSPFSNIG